jgi:hypothetical protein
VQLRIEDCPQRFGRDFWNVMRAHATALFQQEHHRFFANATRSLMLALTTVFVFLKTAHESLFNFYSLAFATQHIGIGFSKRFTNAMAQKSSSFLA